MSGIHDDLEPVCPMCGASVMPRSGTICSVCGCISASGEICESGHSVCMKCRNDKAADVIYDMCQKTKSSDPTEIASEIMEASCIRMHDKMHHVLVGASLLAAYHNSGGSIDLKTSLNEMIRRGRQVPGGSCGYAGTCGAAVSVGIFYSIITNTTPRSDSCWGEANIITARCLERIGSLGGPRCCKRNSYLVIEVASDFVEDKLGISMVRSHHICNMKKRNAVCIENRCPFF